MFCLRAQELSATRQGPEGTVSSYWCLALEWCDRACWRRRYASKVWTYSLFPKTVSALPAHIHSCHKQLWMHGMQQGHCRWHCNWTNLLRHGPWLLERFRFCCDRLQECIDESTIQAESVDEEIEERLSGKRFVCCALHPIFIWSLCGSCPIINSYEHGHGQEYRCSCSWQLLVFVCICV